MHIFLRTHARLPDCPTAQLPNYLAAQLPCVPRARHGTTCCVRRCNVGCLFKGGLSQPG